MQTLDQRDINGVTIFADHADVRRFYYLPTAPRISAYGEQLLIKVLQLRAGVHDRRGGLLSLTVDLGLAPAQLQAVRDQLQRDLGGQPVLTALIPDGGEARLTLFDQMLSAQSARFGDSSATFSVELSEQEATILASALFGPAYLPLGVVYSLPYLAVRPAYRYRVDADWDRVAEAMRTHVGVGLLLLRVDVDNLTQQLIDSQVIRISYDDFSPAEAARDNRDEVLRAVRDTVLDSFFEPLPPIRTPDAAEAPPLGFTLRTTSVTQIDRRTLNLTLNEQTVVRRHIYPQGMLASLRNSGLARERVIIPIDLDDPFFTQRSIEITALTSFAQERITAITVGLRYGDDRRSLRLTSDQPTGRVSWPGQIVDGKLARDVEVTYSVDFVPGAWPVERLTSEPAVERSAILQILPHELYSLHRVPILAAHDFPWTRYRVIEALLRAPGSASQITPISLSADAPTAVWELFAPGQVGPDFQAQLTLVGAGAPADLSLPWADYHDQLFVDNPVIGERAIMITPLVSWDTIREVEVDLSYGGDHQRLSFTSPATQEARFPQVEPDLQLVRYWVTFHDRQDFIAKVPPSLTGERRLFITPNMRGQHVVLLSAAEADFARYQIESILVSIDHEDAQAGLRSMRQFVLTPGATHAVYAFPYVYTAAYRYQLIYRYQDGRTGTVAWAAGDGVYLTLTGRPQADFLSWRVTVDAGAVDWTIFKQLDVWLRYDSHREGHDAQETRLSFDAETAPQEWALTLAAEGDQRYSWRAAARFRPGQRRSRFGDPLYLPGPDERGWQEQSAASLDLTLPSDAALAEARSLFIVRVISEGLDPDQTRLWIAYGGESARSVRLDEGLFLAPLKRALNGAPLRSYSWYAQFGKGSRTVSYPPDGARSMDSSEAPMIDLRQYAPSTHQE